MPADVDDAAIDEALLAWITRASRLARRGNKAAFQAAWDLAFREIKRPRLGYDPQAQAFIERFHVQALRGVSLETREAVRQSLLESIREGKGTEDAAARLAGVMDARRSRLRLIARTELNRAANWGRMQGWTASGVVVKKTWIATHDDRVRPDHLAADGDTVPLTEPFTKGAARGLQSPPAAPNCRCSMAPVTDLFPASIRARPSFYEEFPFLQRLVDEQEEEQDAIWTDLARAIAAATT